MFKTHIASRYNNYYNAYSQTQCYLSTIIIMVVKPVPYIAISDALLFVTGAGGGVG